MPKVIKPGGAIPIDGVVQIPDTSLSTLAALRKSSLDELAQAEMDSSILAEHILERAQEEANESADKILREAEAERGQIMEQANADAQQIRVIAREEAYQEVLRQKRKEIEDSLTEVEEIMNELQERQEQFFAEYEKGLSILALEIAEKIIGEEIRQHSELLRPLVQDAVASVRNADWISVKVSERLPGLVEDLKKNLIGSENIRRIEISASDLPEGGCIIQTPEGIIDASVEVQLENLRTLFETSD